jgi:Prokaryotic phospholipase A2
MRYLLSTVLLIVLAAVLAPAAGAATPADRAEADRIMRLSYLDFVAFKGSANRPARFNWTDDGCSGPGLVGPVYRNLFDKPCQQHDFGYRNYGSRGGGLALQADENTREWIDGRFRSEMNRLCDRTFASWYEKPNKAACLSEAVAVWVAVRNGGRSAFYS